VNQYCEFRTELCEVEDALIEMYNAIQLTPPVDDLEPFLQDVHRLQQSLLELQKKIRNHMNNGASGSHDDFLKKVNEDLSQILDHLSKIDADETKLHDALERIRDLAVMSADQLELENLRNRLDEGVGRDEIEELADMIEKEGMKLERDSGVPLFNEIEKLEAKQSEFDDFEKQLIKDLTATVLKHWNQTKAEIKALNKETYEEIAKELTDLVVAQQNKLPHGFPNIFSWFDEVLEVKGLISDATDNVDTGLELIKQVNLDFTKKRDELKKSYSETLEKWQSQTIDLRDVIVYIEFLEALSKYPDNTDYIPELNQAEIEKLFNWLDKIIKEMEKGRKNLEFKEVKDEFAETDITAESVKAQADETAHKIEELDNLARNNVELENLEETMAGDILSLENKARRANEEAAKVAETREEISSLVKNLLKTVGLRRKKKRSIRRELQRRGRNQKRHRKRQAESFEETIERLSALITDTKNLSTDIENYRRSTNQSGFTYKRYVDTVKEGKLKIERFETSLGEICTNCQVDENMTYEKTVADIESSIDEIREKIRLKTASIYAKIGC